MKRLGLVLSLLPMLALAQVPNLTRLARGTVLSDPLPPAPAGQPVDYWSGVYLDQALGCARFTITGATWLPCTATTSDVSSAVASEASARNTAISTATSGLATTAALNAAIAGEVTARNAAISTATTGLATTASVTAAISAESSARTTAINTAVAPLATTTAVNAAIASATSGLASSSTVAALTTRVATLETQVATLQAQVATLQAYSPPFIPGTAVASGLSIPILGVQTSPVTSTVTGAKLGADCRVGTLGFGLVGATGICEVTAANTVTTRWVSNTGALSALLSIPNGTYPLRVERLP